MRPTLVVAQRAQVSVCGGVVRHSTQCLGQAIFGSRPEPAFDEDYGLTALEAMAHSKPVIVCSDGGGLVETVVDGDNGLVVEPNQSAIAAAVARLHDDPDLAASLGRNGRGLVGDLDWAAYMDRIEHALEAEA